MKKQTLKLLASLLAAGLAASAQGQSILNPSFENSGGSFLGWSTTGAASIKTSSFVAPTDGAFEAFMNNGSGSVSAASLSSFFSGAALPGNGVGAATDGTGISQTFTFSAATAFSFDWKFLTAETIGSGYDQAFYYLDGNVTLLASASSPGLTSSEGATGYANGLAYQTINLSLHAGVHTIGFGVYNTGDQTVNSGLLVDNLAVSLAVASVPEPSTLAMAGLGGLSLLLFRKRK